MSSNSGDIFAEPMLDGDDFLKRYIAKLAQLQKEGLLPDLEKKLTYKVYSIKGSEFGSHKSIVLTDDGQHFFTVELGFINVDGVKRIYPITRNLPANVKEKLVYHGEIRTTGGDLISKAVATMKNFGKYFKFCNNCQDYCNYYLEAIGLGEQKTLTDGDKSILGVASAGILALLISCLRALVKLV